MYIVENNSHSIIRYAEDYRIWCMHVCNVWLVFSLCGVKKQNIWLAVQIICSTWQSSRSCANVMKQSVCEVCNYIMF
jgi:hypothetical protein